ncbi:sce7725 family protein [uncultured Salinibacterium sp.]|uniref:sce7725 family protein n=1 Tax=uncultured Salinibacterium sp. TaxID=459274 RepID=UPI0030DB8C58|tara:strand:+ start:62193 stop:63125 length:933 start_codon:yes stop_codon:yes gene_type:complete
MYFPYFRGKQFELIAIRECAEVIAEAGFNPIIEPVRETFTGLQRTLDELLLKGANATVIVNPRHGDHRDSSEILAQYMADSHGDNDAISPALLLTSDLTVDDATKLIEPFADRPLTLVHAGFTDGKVLANSLQPDSITHVFLDARNTLYRRPFKGARRILIEDGFERTKNADYDLVNRFSDLHVTYEELGGDGYGDFLTVGDHYSEGGGPAYAVAIHLTYIDPSNDDAMFVYHFKSDSNDTPVDPAGKFAQALAKLISAVDDPHTKILSTTAVEEFRDLHERKHFPGLGYVKKLSIKHHIETLADYHANA